MIVNACKCVRLFCICAYNKTRSLLSNNKDRCCVPKNLRNSKKPMTWFKQIISVFDDSVV